MALIPCRECIFYIKHERVHSLIYTKRWKAPRLSNYSMFHKKRYSISRHLIGFLVLSFTRPLKMEVVEPLQSCVEVAEIEHGREVSLVHLRVDLWC